MKDGARRGFSECQLQRINQSEPWNCPLEMYNKLPLFDNKTFLTSKSAVLTFGSIIISVHSFYAVFPKDFVIFLQPLAR